MQVTLAFRQYLVVIKYIPASTVAVFASSTADLRFLALVYLRFARKGKIYDYAFSSH